MLDWRRRGGKKQQQQERCYGKKASASVGDATGDVRTASDHVSSVWKSDAHGPSQPSDGDNIARSHPGDPSSVYRCRNTACPRFHQPTRPEEEGGWALPHGEFGLDVIALVGALRYQQQRSIPQIHEDLLRRGLVVAQRTVTDQLYRYEELLALHLADAQRLRERLSEQKQVILALDGLQPDVGHEVLWVLRDCGSGEVLVARSLLGATENDLVPLLEEAASICRQLDIPIVGVITDGQHSIRNAVAHALPGIPHQLCHFHYLREAAKPIAAADLHAKKELKKHVRGVRPLERELEERTDEEAEAVRHYCLAESQCTHR